MSEQQFCKGNPHEQEPCYCEEYSAPTNVPAGQKALCAECLHGRSKHPRPQQPVPVGDQSVPRQAVLDQGTLQNAAKPMDTTAKERLGVTAVYKQSLARRTGKATELIFDSGMTFPNSGAATAVRSEVMAGFRPNAKGKVTARSRVVSSKQASSSTLKQGKALIKVGAVAVLINYLDENGDLIIKTPPVKTELSKLKRRGCAHFDENEVEENKVDFSFCPDWTFKEVDEYFQRLFPKVFTHLDALKRGDVKGKSADKGALWVLISKENRSLSVAPELFPNGKHLERYRGRNNAPLALTNIFIAIRKNIPEHIYAQWDPEMVVIDIDDDAGDNQDDGSEDSLPDHIITPRPPLKRSTRYNEREIQGPARKKLRGTRGQPIAATSQMENKESSSTRSQTHKRKLKFFQLLLRCLMIFAVFSPGSDSENDVDMLPASLKQMSISPRATRHAPPTQNFMMPSIKDEERHIDLQGVFTNRQNHSSTTSRPLFRPLVSVQPTMNDILRGHPDVNDPFSRPFHNPWTADYFIGSIKLWL